MNQTYKIALALTVAALTGPAAFAGYVDVTIADPHRDKSFTPGTPGATGNLDPALPENNRVEWNAAANQSWDLESFQFDASASLLKMTGGFNFATGQGYTGEGKASSTLITTTYQMGDIFLYLNKAPYTTPNENDTPVSHKGPWEGSDQWDFAISFVRDVNGNIQVVKDRVEYVITAKSPNNDHQTAVTLPGTGVLNQNLPWKANGADFSNPLPATYYASGDQKADPDLWFNEIQGIDLSSILPAISGQTVYAHTTMRCGNDVMWGQFQPVPDGGTTLVLLGSGLVGLALLRRRIA